MTVDNKEQADNGRTENEQSENENAQLNGGPSKVAQNADAKIQAHRKQHQRQLKKIMGIAAIVITAVLLVVVGRHLLTSNDSNDKTPFALITVPELSEADAAKFREQFKQALTQYEITIQPDISQIMVTDWESGRATELSLLKEQGVTAFAQGSFMQAKQLLESLNEKSITLIRDWESQIALHVEAGENAFNANQIPVAQLNVNKALALSSTNTSALQLQSRIYAHGEVAKLMNDLDVAINENDLPKQVEVITGIIELDPLRTDLNVDLASVKAQYDQQRLAQYLAQADTALQNGQFTKAQQLVNQATAIKPSSKGATALTARIKQAKARRGLSSFKTDIKAASEKDNWSEVNTLLKSILPKHPFDEDLKKYQLQAQQVLAAKKSLTPFIKRLDRLSDENIRNAATQTIQSSFAASLLSPSLQQDIEVLANGIDQYNSPVEVTINSDAQTYIIVIGVGHVGQHQEKVISLTPGKYVLQGKKEGFRNKRLEFTVKANTPISLSLICDEPI